MTDTCKTCNGTGVYSSPDDMNGETVTNKPCPDCNADGERKWDCGRTAGERISNKPVDKWRGQNDN